MLYHPCILGDPQQRGQIKAGPKEGGNATSPICIPIGILKQRGQIKADPKGGEMLAFAPALFGDPQTKADRVEAPNFDLVCLCLGIPEKCRR